MIAKGFITHKALNMNIKTFPYQESTMWISQRSLLSRAFERGLLKVIVKLAVCTAFSGETLSYMASLINGHRNLLIDLLTFPDFPIRPKQHFVDHYPHFIRCFGPLASLWTMRFEANALWSETQLFQKGCAQNFNNVLLTLATKHQDMLAYYLDRDDLFRQSVYIECQTFFNLRLGGTP